MKKILLPLCILIGLTGNCLAQIELKSGLEETNTVNLKDYYVVEFTVFTNESKNNIDQEIWPNDITLNHPEVPTLLSNSHSIYDIYPELKTGLKPKPDGSTDLGTPSEQTKNHEGSDTDTTLPAADFLPLLTKADHEHTDALSRFKWSRQHRILFHQAWLQKIGSENEAANIVIQSKDSSYEIQELAGSIKIYKGRYLHLRTNLWLVNFKTEEELSVALTNTLKETEEASTLATVEPTESNIFNTTIDTSGIITGSLNPTTEPKTLEDETTTEQIVTDWPIPPTLNLADFFTNEDNEKTSKKETTAEKDTLKITTETERFNEAGNATELQYLVNPINRIALLQQKRRLRSREIHYLDHPLFGILIEIRHYQPPKPKTAKPENN